MIAVEKDGLKVWCIISARINDRKAEERTMTRDGAVPSNQSNLKPAIPYNSRKTGIHDFLSL